MSPVLSSRTVKVSLLLLGLMALIGFVVHIGPERIDRAGASLGAVGVAVMLVPSTLMYLLDCLGWRFTLGQHSAAVPFSRLFVIRTAGELVNATTPTAYVEGEPPESPLAETIRDPHGRWFSFRHRRKDRHDDRSDRLIMPGMSENECGHLHEIQKLGS
jgi:hypothetical protein